MINKIKYGLFVGIFSLFAVLGQVIAKYDTNTCKGSSCPSERKELTPEEKECIEDSRTFTFSYNIIKGLHLRYAEEFGTVPEIVQRDLAEADAAWYEFESYVGKSSLYANYWANAMFFGLTGPTYALVHCKEMYAKEMNDRTHSNHRFSPESREPFLKNNFVCHTSYEDALQNIRRIVQKYKNGHRCPRD